MLDMSLGSGIALGATLGSLFLGAATVAIVWVNNIYSSSCQETGEAETGTGARKSDGETAQNGYIRRGEHDKGIESLHKRLDDMHKENRDWYKELNSKVDRVSGELKEQHEANQDFRSRLVAIETFQQHCPARSKVREKTENPVGTGKSPSG